MIKATLEFDNQDDLLAALNGWRKQAAIEEVDNELYRPNDKHGYADDEINKVIAHLDSLCEANNTPEGLWVGDLIRTFRRKYWEIINGEG